MSIGPDRRCLRQIGEYQSHLFSLDQTDGELLLDPGAAAIDFQCRIPDQRRSRKTFEVLSMKRERNKCGGR